MKKKICPVCHWPAPRGGRDRVRVPFYGPRENVLHRRCALPQSPGSHDEDLGYFHFVEYGKALHRSFAMDRFRGFQERRKTF